MGKFRFTFNSLQLTILRQLPVLTAGFAENLTSLAVHTVLGLAVGALVEHAVQPFSPIGSVLNNLILELPGVVVVFKPFLYPLLDGFCVKRLHFLLGEQQFQFCGGRNAAVGLIPRGFIDVMTVRDQGNYRNLQIADHFPE